MKKSWKKELRDMMYDEHKEIDGHWYVRNDAVEFVFATILANTLSEQEEEFKQQRKELGNNIVAIINGASEVGFTSEGTIGMILEQIDKFVEEKK
jgi:predicted translin family RNA/ssDNA-binding protein